MKDKFRSLTNKRELLYLAYLFIFVSFLMLLLIYEASNHEQIKQITQYIQQAAYQSSKSTITETLNTLTTQLRPFVQIPIVLCGGLFFFTLFLYIRQSQTSSQLTYLSKFKTMLVPLFGIFLFLGFVFLLFQPQIEKQVEQSQFSFIQNHLTSDSFSTKESDLSTKLTVKIPTTIQALAQTNRLTSLKWTKIILFMFMKVLLVTICFIALFVAYFHKKSRLKKHYLPSEHSHPFKHH